MGVGAISRHLCLPQTKNAVIPLNNQLLFRIDNTVIYDFDTTMKIKISADIIFFLTFMPLIGILKY